MPLRVIRVFKDRGKLHVGNFRNQGHQPRPESVEGSQQTVTVQVHPPNVDTDDSRLEATLSSETVRDLPSANRNLWDILAVTPGVVGVGTRLAGEAPGGLPDNIGTQTPQISANRRRYTGNLVLVDGMKTLPVPLQNGNIILAPIPDAVQEASLQTNSWDGEINLGSSILIQVTTKSGTNQYHGTGNSLFFRQSGFAGSSGFHLRAEPSNMPERLGGHIRWSYPQRQDILLCRRRKTLGDCARWNWTTAL